MGVRMRATMLRVALVGMTTCAALAIDAPAAPAAPKAKVQVAALDATSKEVRRSAFNGNEVGLTVFYSVNPDCSSGPLVDVRIVKPPANGEITFQEMAARVEYPKEHFRAHCNGQTVNAVKALYTSHENFVGIDRMQIEVAYKTGYVRRYSVIMDVR